MDSMKDIDPEETSEWLEALRAAVAAGGRERGLYLLTQLEQQAQQLGVVAHVMPYSAYQNTLPLDEQAVHPGDVAIEERLTAIMRWNALAMVVRANKAYGELGGHVATYASAAEIFEAGFHPVLSRESRWPAALGRYHRGRSAFVLGCSGHRLQRARRNVATALYLFKSSASSGSVISSGRRPTSAGAGVLARRDGRPHHAWRRGFAASRRVEPSRRSHRPELPGLRSRIRRRARDYF